MAVALASAHHSRWRPARTDLEIGDLVESPVDSHHKTSHILQDLRFNDAPIGQRLLVEANVRVLGIRAEGGRVVLGGHEAFGVRIVVDREHQLLRGDEHVLVAVVLQERNGRIAWSGQGIVDVGTVVRAQR